MAGPRLAVRAVIVARGRLLLVNAWPDGLSDLWCAPGGGVEAGQALPEALRREVREETGLAVTVGAPCLVNEFHDPAGGFHQVEVFFRCTLAGAAPDPARPDPARPDSARPDPARSDPAWSDPAWPDPAGIVTRRRWFARDELAGVRFKPGLLPEAAWGQGMLYDPLEPIVR